jgi:hypothetical protein
MIPPSNLFELLPEDKAKMEADPEWRKHSQELRDKIRGVKAQKKEIKQRKKAFRAGFWGF